MGLRIAISLVAIAAACAACSESTAGQATSSPTPTGTTTTSVAPPTTTDSGMKGKTDFSQDELCELLSGDEAKQLGGSEEGEPSMNVETWKPICTWTDANSLFLGFRDDGVVADLATGPGITKTQIKIGNTPGVQSDDKTSGGFCQVGFDLNDHSNLIAGVSILTGGQGKYDRCEVAKEMAAIVLSKVK